MSDEHGILRDIIEGNCDPVGYHKETITDQNGNSILTICVYDPDREMAPINQQGDQIYFVTLPPKTDFHLLTENPCDKQAIGIVASLGDQTILDSQPYQPMGGNAVLFVDGDGSGILPYWMQVSDTASNYKPLSSPEAGGYTLLTLRLFRPSVFGKHQGKKVVIQESTVEKLITVEVDPTEYFSHHAKPDLIVTLVIGDKNGHKQFRQNQA